MTYLSTILADSPTSVWMLDEASGATAADSSGNGHNATYSSISSYRSAGPSSSIPYGVALASISSSHVQLPAAGVVVDAINGITLEAWVNVTTLTDWARIFDLGDGSSTNNLLLIPRDGSTSQTSGWVFTGGSSHLAAGVVISAGAWYHVVFTISASGAAAIYINGVQKATGSVNAPGSATRGFAYIGRSDWGTDPYLDAEVAACALYPYVLTSTQVTTHYNAGNPIVGSLSLSAAVTAAGAGTASGSLSLTGVVTGSPASGSAALTLSGSATPSLRASASASLSLSGSAIPSIPTSTWVGDDEERWQIPFEWSFVVDVEPVEDPPPTTHKNLEQTTVSMPAPTLVNGRPQQPWVPTVTRSSYGHYQLVIAGHDRSRPRGMPFIPLSDSDNEPFGDADASFAFPGITEWDDPSAWSIKDLAPVRLRRKDSGGTFHTVWEGEIASLEPDTGSGLIIHCIGTLYRVDLLKEPPDLLDREEDRGRIIARIINSKRSEYNLHVGRMAIVDTGILGLRGGQFDPAVSGAIQNHLSMMTTDAGDQWTVHLDRPRTPVLELKDMTTVHAHARYGTPGIVVNMPKDFTTATTGVFASGSNGHCSWMGARFPNYRGRDVPAFPLAPGNVFNSGDGQTGFAPFANLLRAGDFNMQSSDTYLSTDVDEVEAFQERVGITVDGIVGAQTWEAAFQPGYNAGSIAGAYVGPVYEKSATRKRLYDQFGSDIGPNPNYDPTVPAIQDYMPFGDNVSKRMGRKSAKQIVNRNYPAGRSGDIELTVDPTGSHRMDLTSGKNIRIDDINGVSVLCHIIRAERERVTGRVTLTVDDKSRDLLTWAAIHQRDRDVADATRREKFGRTRSRVFNDYGQWLCEDGAGEYPLENLQGGFWNVQRIAAAPKGTIERVSFCAGTGLTEALLDANLSGDPPSTIPGAARFAIYILASPVTANQMESMMPAPLTFNADGTAPADAAQDRLKKFGVIFAAGGPGQACGFYPNNDPGDGSSLHLSGRFEDGGGVGFGPTGHYWLWVALWSPVSCKIGGRIFPGAPN